MLARRVRGVVHASACTRPKLKHGPHRAFLLWHKVKAAVVVKIMQTYAIPSQSDLSRLAHLAASGQEVMLTENNRPLARLVPLDEAEAWRRDMQALEGFAKGIPAFEREEDEERG